MKQINFKRTFPGQVESFVILVTEALKKEGFGVLTRIDFDCKIKEKLGETISPVVILGACHPGLAYQAYLKNTDVSSLIPCNAVIREIGNGEVSVELMKPSIMMEVLGEPELAKLSEQADQSLQRVLSSLA